MMLPGNMLRDNTFMTPIKSESQTIYEEAKSRELASFLGHYPKSLDEAIATHYAQIAAYSMQMCKLIQFRRDCPNEVSYNECQKAIDHLREQIKQSHINSFGLPPNWPVR